MRPRWLASVPRKISNCFQTVSTYSSKKSLVLTRKLIKQEKRQERSFSRENAMLRTKWKNKLECGSANKKRPSKPFRIELKSKSNS